MMLVTSFPSSQVLHTSIASIERRPPTNTTALVILLKDFRRFILEFQTTEECTDVADAMDILSRPGTSPSCLQLLTFDPSDL